MNHSNISIPETILDPQAKSDQKLETSENFHELFTQYINEKGYENRLTEGVVTQEYRDYVMVDIGLKSEGIIAKKEFSILEDIQKVSKGETFNVFIEKFEGRGGLTVLSREKAIRNDAWNKFKIIHAENEIIEGTIIGRVKGGFAVELGGIIAFLPGSQVDIKPIKDIPSLLEGKQKFKILKMDETQGNIVISRRLIIEEIRNIAKSDLLSKIKEGSILKGIVKNITDYGAFIDLESTTDGLLHITDISWSKINHPSEVLEVGQELEVKVIKYDEANQRISLGLKQMTGNPWEILKEKYKEGSKTKGKVVRIVDYGAFVELEPNVEGLVYYTQIGWLTRNIHTRKLVSIGDIVEVEVLTIDVDKHRISLSMKTCQENPWIKFAEKYPIGTELNCVVRNVTDFGLFVVLEEDKEKESTIVMLVPPIELSWDTDPAIEIKKYNKNDTIKCVILTSDPERERIGASIRKLHKDQINEEIQNLIEKDYVEGKITEVKNEGLSINIDNNYKGFISKSEISNNKDEQDTRSFSVGDIIECKLINFNQNKRTAYGSIKELQAQRESKAFSSQNLFFQINAANLCGINLYLPETFNTKLKRQFREI